MKLTRLYQALFRTWTGIPRALGSPRALFPFEVSLSITHRCNLNCGFCLERDLLNQDDDELSTEEWRTFIGSTPRLSMCVFAGGEPFLRPDFLEILDFTMRRRRTLVITNGSIVPDEFASRAVAGKLLLVSFSLDGIGATHDTLRNLDGCFDRVCAAIEKLAREKANRRARLPLISISTVLLPQNLGQVAEIAALAARLGADFVTFSLHSPPVQCITTLSSDELMRPRTDITRYDTAVLREEFRRTAAMRRKPDVRFLPVFRSPESLLSYLEREDDVTLPDVFHPCTAPYGAVFVTPNGDVFPCRIFYPAGNVRRRSFGELWNSRALGQFRTRLRAEKIFPSCVRCCRLMEK